MIEPKQFVEQFAEAVKIASDAVLPRLQQADNMIRTINYQFGSAAEIRETLIQQDYSTTDKFLKYPLIACITPFTEQRGLPGGYHSKIINPKIGIAYHTDKGWKAGERYSNSFTNIILPLYDALIDALLQTGYFVAITERDFKIKRLIRDDIGRNPFLNIDGATSDYIDAVEFQESEFVRDYGDCNNCKQH